MITLIALIISILLQFVAAIYSIRLTKVTKYRLSWILISVGFLFMAIRRFIEFISFLGGDYSQDLGILNNWLGIVTSLLITAGVILITELFNYLKKVEKAREESEKEILNAIIKTEEKERKRFAKDLHDGLGPILSTVKLSISTLSQIEHKKRNKEIISNTEVVINEALKSIKEISNNLSPHILNNFGLASAIKSFTNKIVKSKAINISFNSNMHDERLDENVEVVLYRIVCELMNNTVKHASANNIGIDLIKNNNLIKLVYTDDGKGFDVEKVLNEKTSGMGYSNMLTRIKSLKGKLNINSSKEKGTEVVIEVNI